MENGNKPDGLSSDSFVRSDGEVYNPKEMQDVMHAFGNLSALEQKLFIFWMDIYTKAF